MLGKKYSSVFLLIFFSLMALDTIAQTTVQVVTKSVEKRFDYSKGDEINIEGEKAEVSIESWKKQQILIKVELISKHPEKMVAEKDLGKLIYEAKREKNKIYLRNYISTPEGQAKPKSKLSVKYTIFLPESCPVYLKNHFGSASISNLTNSLRVNSKFSKIDLIDIQGMIEVTTRFGDLIGERINGRMSVNSRRSDVMLHDIRGSYNIQAYYGMVKIFSEDELLDLKVDAEKADVFLFAPNPAMYGYNLTSTQGKINLPNSFDVKEVQNTQVLKQVEVRPIEQEYYQNVTIRVTFGNITVDKKPN
ncbi:MAG: hypothetical protein DWQ02_10385 [Bacteroidetes bacterium]|nr:MAG: hypothetical protein DWQ02_10385 [Bacteroidota bacterium]